MGLEFWIERENELIGFIQTHYGMEIFTPGLDRTRELYLPSIEYFKKMGTKITIIAGTNGKGQSAHTLAHYLHSCGQRFGLWISPHILSIRERFTFNEGDVSYEVLDAEIQETHTFIQNHLSSPQISFYEFLFLVFLRLAQKQGVRIDHLILEVGLGGRLDAVNHFDADCACITSISRDHQAILGNRYDLILKEKLAVARAHKPLFTSFPLDYLNHLTQEYCEVKQVSWRPLSKNIRHEQEDYFQENQKMAQALFFELMGSEQKLPTEEVPTFKGRREEMTFKGNTLIFIGAHNIDGVRRMTELFLSTPKELWPTRVLMSFSKRPEKEVEVMLKSLVDFFGKKTKMDLTSFEHPKAQDLKELREVEKKINEFSKGLLDFVTDWKIDLNHTNNQKILVCGSYYFIGEVQRFIYSHS